jgi:hypothetical protein
MVVRSGRLLPSVIVGALVTGALVLGAGVAEAAPLTCTANGKTGIALGDKCVNPLNVDDVFGLLDPVTQPAAETPSQAPVVDPSPAAEGSDTGSGGVVGAVGGAVGGVVDSVRGNSPAAGGSGTGTNPSAGAGSEATSGSGAGSGSSGPSAPAGGSVAPVVPAPSGVQAPDVRGGLLPPAVSAPGGLAARVPALGFGAVDPRLLMVPTGSPLRTLTGVTPGSPVTTSSDVQAMALDGLPSGLGTPAVLGVLILSTLAGFALRHRVLRRVRLAAAPEPEPA